MPLEEISDTKIQIGNSKEKNREEIVVTRQDELTTISHTQQDDGTYKSDYVSNFDHFSFLAEYEKMMNLKIERVNPQKYCKNLVEYWETVSDHAPIKMTIDFNKRAGKRIEQFWGG